MRADAAAVNESSEQTTRQLRTNFSVFCGGDRQQLADRQTTRVDCGRRLSERQIANLYSNARCASTALQVHSSLAGWPTTTNQWRWTSSHVTATAAWRMFAVAEPEIEPFRRYLQFVSPERTEQLFAKLCSCLLGIRLPVKLCWVNYHGFYVLR